MKTFLVLGAVNMCLAVALGAFGAHGLKKHVTEALLATWNTAVLYHLVHALGLLLVGILQSLFPQLPHLAPAGWWLVAGLILFCGSLYLLVVTGSRPLGMITPFGGISFIAGWLLLAAAFFRMR